MKTYESERKELYDWIVERTKKYFEQEKNADVNGFDSVFGLQNDADMQTYVKKLNELKIKYHIN